MLQSVVMEINFSEIVTGWENLSKTACCVSDERRVGLNNPGIMVILVKSWDVIKTWVYYIGQSAITFLFISPSIKQQKKNMKILTTYQWTKVNRNWMKNSFFYCCHCMKIFALLLWLFFILLWVVSGRFHYLDFNYEH